MLRRLYGLVVQNFECECGVNVFWEVVKKRWMSERKNEKSCTARKLTEYE